MMMNCEVLLDNNPEKICFAGQAITGTLDFTVDSTIIVRSKYLIKTKSSLLNYC
jgi:hypothetical protein